MTRVLVLLLLGLLPVGCGGPAAPMPDIVAAQVARALAAAGLLTALAPASLATSSPTATGSAAQGVFYGNPDLKSQD
jgi:hypothetical protein